MLGLLSFFVRSGASAFPHAPVLATATEMLFLLALVAGIAALSERTWVWSLAAGGAIFLILIQVLRSIDPTPRLVLLGTTAGMSAFLLLTAVVLLQTFREGPVTRRRIEGAVATYLLFGILFAFAYTLIERLRPGSFTLAAGSDDPSRNLIGSLVYYSFVTLTSVGFGDVLAVSASARGLTMAEAVVGQLFPAILLARLVSLSLLEHASREAVVLIEEAAELDGPRGVRREGEE